ncbi:hypothetical protein P7C71_g6395, partial [Lecanoromycetidae sp. Uapishka_2]
MSQHAVSETSPLLGKQSSVLPDAGDAPNGAPPSTLEGNGHSNGQMKPAEDEESQTSEDSAPPYEGAAVLVAAVFTMLLGLDWGSNNAWSDDVTIVCLCLTFPLFALFLFVEFKVAAEPFAPRRIIFERSLVACYFCNFFSFAGWLAVLFYLPLFFQAVDGLSASQAGVRLLPGIVAGVSGSLFGGLLMQRTGKYYWLTVSAYTTLTLGLVPVLLCSGLVVNNTYGISVGLVMCGFSNGIGVTTSLIGLIANASTEDQAVATAWFIREKKLSR